MERLSIPKKVEFAIKLEVNGMNVPSMNDILNGKKDYIAKDDQSIKNTGIEIISPILHNKKSELNGLKNKLSKVIERDHNFDDSSIQISFNYSLIKDIDNLEYFLKVFAIYEDIIYHYLIGNNPHFIDSIDICNSPIKNFLIEFLSKNFNNSFLIKSFQNSKIDAISIKDNSENKTLLEYQLINGTLDFDEILDYINFLYYLTISHRYIDREKIDYMFSQVNPLLLMDCYLVKKSKKAEELANMIFTKEKDKSLFLSRYDSITVKKAS